MEGIILLFISTGIFYAGFRILRALFYYLSYYFVLWKVARGSVIKKRSIPAKDRLHIFVCPTDFLDESSVSELHTFLGKLVNSNLDIQGFQKLLLSYSYVATYREKRDGSLRGMSLVDIGRKELNKKTYIVMEVGACFYEKAYRGSLCMHYVLAYFRFKEFLCHPFTPFLLVGQCFGYKSYALLTHTFQDHVYPNYRSETPDHMRHFIDDFAKKNKQEGDFYDPETFVFKKDNFYYMKNAVAEAHAVDTKDPDTDFFVKRNPRWAEGYQLITVVSLGVADIMCLIYRILWKLMKGNSNKWKKPKLLRRNTYQSDYANQSSWKIIQELDLAGNFYSSLTEDDMDDLEV